MGAVFGLYSRKLLALDVAPREIDARFATRLLDRAIRAHEERHWVVSDHGAQFTSARCTAFLRRRHIRRRFGAIGKPGAVALDQVVPHLKDEFARELFLFRPLPGLRRDLACYVRWYITERPHCSLEYRTPDEVIPRWPTAARSAHRARPARNPAPGRGPLASRPPGPAGGIVRSFDSCDPAPPLVCPRIPIFKESAFRGPLPASSPGRLMRSKAPWAYIRCRSRRRRRLHTNYSYFEALRTNFTSGISS